MTKNDLKKRDHASERAQGNYPGADMTQKACHPSHLSFEKT